MIFNELVEKVKENYQREKTEIKKKKKVENKERQREKL
jgi:hypothetical protein